MLHSMTGFARQIAESPSGTLSCEIRAVNHRYLDVQFRLPEELRAKETEFRRQVGDILQRGKVDCQLHFRRAESRERSLPLNRELLARLAERSAELAELLPATRGMDPLDVLRWPGVVEEQPLEVEPLFIAASALLATTLEALNAMRRSEGSRIEDMLGFRCEEILSIAGSVRLRMPEVLARVREKQRERIAKLDVTADPARLEIELALIGQKLDVDEELDRLQSHVSEIRQNLDA
ncbi:MAG: YicC family protein, partial [Halioglobus sp.]|nr:YicC family protein [Halioglobus sp.]